jgi:hypothetical protein
MKKKAKLDDIDVVFDPTPLTKEEELLLSKFIQELKDKRRKKFRRKRIAA